MKPLAGGAIEDGRLALRFICANPDVTVVIPGMYDVSEIEKNIELKNVYKEKRTAHYDIRPYEDLRSDESGRCANVYDISITSAIPLILNHIHTQTDQVED